MKEMDALRAQGKQIWEKLGRYKYIILVILAGVLLMLLPASRDADTQQEPVAAVGEEFSVKAMEQKLAESLAHIEGAGRVRVMLTVESGMKRVWAQDTSMEQEGTALQRETKTVVISTGSGKQEAVLIEQVYPKFQGALVVTSGGGDPTVRLELTKAVSALTGLGADKISICKGK